MKKLFAVNVSSIRVSFNDALATQVFLVRAESAEDAKERTRERWATTYNDEVSYNVEVVEVDLNEDIQLIFSEYMND